jgi:hypothetical protein
MNETASKRLSITGRNDRDQILQQTGGVFNTVGRGWFPALLYENYVLEAANAAKAANSGSFTI